MIEQNIAFSAFVVRSHIAKLQGLDEDSFCQAFQLILQSNEELRTHLSVLLNETSALALLTEAGVPGDRGFWGDLTYAIKMRILSKSVSLRDLTYVCETLLPEPKDWKWFAGLKGKFYAALSEILSEVFGAKIWKPLRADFLDALEFLAARIVTTGLSPTLRSYDEKIEQKVTASDGLRQTLHDSAFFRMQVQLRLLIDEVGHLNGRGSVASAGSARLVQVRCEVRECWQNVQRFSNELARSGVSIDIVSRLQVIRACLSRIEEILELLTNENSSEADFVRFVARLVRYREQELRLAKVFRTHLSLIARKITEHAGEKGEHYVSRTKAEYRKMFLSASGAGAFTALTCFLKTMIASSGLAPLWEAVLTGLNYGMSFVVLYHLGLSLATKQPSMTAAHLAAALANENDRNSNPVGELAAHISRSQLVAVAGNLLAVIPAAVALEYLFRVSFDSGILAPEKAEKILAAFDFLNPSLWLYSAITGVILWLSSLFSGLAENFSVFYRLPQAIEQRAFSVRIRLPVAAKLLRWFAPQFKKHISGWSANLSLGAMLALPALVGRIIGVAADARHVTLGAGLVTLSAFATVAAQNFTLDAQAVLVLARALLGVLAVGAINILVSFSCSLSIAMLARNESLARVRWVIRTVLKHLRAKPKEFFLPPM